MRNFWLKRVFDLSGKIHHVKKDFVKLSSLKTVVFSFYIIFLEVILGLLSLPLYLTRDYKKEPELFNIEGFAYITYRVRKRITLSASSIVMATFLAVLFYTNIIVGPVYAATCTISSNQTYAQADLNTCAGGTLTDLVVDAGVTLTLTGAVTVTNSVTVNGKITHTAADNGITQNPGVNITAASMTIASGGSIDVDAKGCQGGSWGNGYGPNATTGICAINTTGGGAGAASHGGRAINAYGYSYTSMYGSNTAPILLGSGGSSSLSNNGGYGGGRITLNISGTLTVTGAITADGSSPAGPAGSGGSIYIITGTLAGAGTIGADTGSNNYPAGGGRVAVYYSALSGFTLGNITAAGGTGGGDSRYAEAGTVYTFANNSAPTVSITSAVQKTDGTGDVDIVLAFDDADDDNGLKAKVEYKAGSDCSSGTSDPTLDETDGDTTAVFGDPKVENDNAYQVGNASGWILTSSGSNTVNIDWNSATDVVSANGTYCVKVTPNDATADGTAQTTTLTLDNVDPTASGSLTLNAIATTSLTFDYGLAGSDTNINHYKVYYKAGASGVATSDTQVGSNIASGSYNADGTVQITSLSVNTQYVANIWTFDSYGNSTGASEIAKYTAANVPSAPTVTASTTSALLVVVNVNSNPASTEFAICKTTNGTSCVASGNLQIDGSLGSSEVWRTYANWGGATGVSATGFTANTAYQFIVKARNGNNTETAFSSANTAAYTHANQVSSVTSADATVTTTLQQILSWSNNSQTGLKIERDNGCDTSYDVTIYNNASVNDTTPTTTFVNLSANTCYAYRFSSYNGGGDLNTASRPITSNLTTPPAQVTSVSATNIETSEISWSWNSVTGADSYRVYNNATGALLSTVTAPTVVYTWSSLSPNVQYALVVRALSNSNGQGIASSAASAYTDASAPSGLSHGSQTATAITWSWTNGGQSDFYARNKNNTSDNSGWLGAGVVQWAQTGLTANTAYTMEVKAKNGDNTDTAYTEITRYTSQNTPATLTFSGVTNSSITVAVAGSYPNNGTGSALIHYDNGVGVTQDVTNASDFSWANSSLTANTQYTYTAYAQNGDADQTSSANDSEYTLANTPGTLTAAVTANPDELTLTLAQNSNPAATNVLLYSTTTAAYVDTVTKTLTGDTTDFDTFTNWGTVTLQDLATNTAYQFVSVARNGDSVLTATSSASTAVYTAAAVPVTIVGTVNGTGEITVTWGANGNPNSTQYYAQAIADPTFSSGWITTSTYTFTGLTPNTTYALTVKARNGNQVETASVNAVSSVTTNRISAVPTAGSLWAAPVLPSRTNPPVEEVISEQAQPAERRSNGGSSGSSGGVPYSTGQANEKNAIIIFDLDNAGEDVGGSLSVRATSRLAAIANKLVSAFTKIITATKFQVMGKQVALADDLGTVVADSVTSKKVGQLSVLLEKDIPKEVDLNNDGVNDLRVIYRGLDQKGEPKYEFEHLSDKTELNNAFSINAGDYQTTSREVTLYHNVLNVKEVAVSNRSDFANSSFESYKKRMKWTLGKDYGTKIVYVRYKSNTGAVSDSYDIIELINPNILSDQKICPLPVKQAFKTKSGPGVYYILESCTKRPFLNSLVYFTHFDSWSEVSLVDSKILSSIPDDVITFMSLGPKHALEDGALVKMITDPNVYLLQNNSLRLVVSEKVFNLLKYSFSNVVDVSEDLFNKFEKGQDIEEYYISL